MCSAFPVAARAAIPCATGVVLTDGRLLVSSWTDSTMTVLRDRTMARLVSGLPSPADAGVDSKRHGVAVSLYNDGRVELWQIPASR